MSAKPETTKPETVSLTIDGREIEAAKGSRVIDVADREGIDIPRFCYHRKLSAPANCRMCLVDIEMGGRPAPKPMPACITNVGDGMVVRTRSERALKAQRGVMEFLLINHPLDCPICDQGGECELQDIAMGYGRSVSRFNERKRVVKDENLGPLISTDMTRCIHCTRCVRFLDEIAGTAELAALHRGEHMEIGTWVGGGVHSELSGNIIDLCPVGALTSKPYRYRARAWEMVAQAGVAPHDALGSNLNIHHVRGVVKRVVPRENESINQTWISDRDRWSYEGIYAADRLERPLVRGDGGEWQESDWQTALEATTAGLRNLIDRHGAAELGALVGTGATLEEMYLLARLMRGLGSDNIDYRTRQGDFRDDGGGAVYPSLGMSLAELETLDAALLVGGYPRHDQPMLNHRLRRAAHAGARVMAINPRRFDWNVALEVEHVVPAAEMVAELALVAAAAAARQEREIDGLDAFTGGASPEKRHENLAAALAEGEHGGVLLGNLVETHAAGAELRALGALLADLTGARYGVLTHGANAAGGWVAGALPTRRADGSGADGLNARAMIEAPRRGYVVHAIEPEHDAWDPAATVAALRDAEFTLVLSPYITEAMRAYADIVLPVGAFGETAGTFVNAQGDWQTFTGIGRPVGEARPAWRLLRVLGNLLDLDGFDYQAPDAIHAEVWQAFEAAGMPPPATWQPEALTPQRCDGLARAGAASLYGVDPVVRRARSLQQTPQAARDGSVRIAPALAERLSLGGAEWVRVAQGDATATLPMRIDANIAENTVWLPTGISEAAGLGALGGPITLEKGES